MALSYSDRMRHLRCVCEFTGKVENYPTKADPADYDKLGAEGKAEYADAADYVAKVEAGYRMTLEQVKVKVDEAAALVDVGEVLATAADYTTLAAAVDAKIASVGK